MSAFMAPPEKLPAAMEPASSRVLAELWTSFVGLTRSHLAALQTNGQLLQVKVTETSVNSFIAGDLDGNVAVTLSSADGRGTYEMESCGGAPAKGSWQLYGDGTASVDDGGKEDMELAVEFFARKLVAARLKGATR